MSRKFVEPLTELIVVALSPLLIMFMVGSLVFYLEQLLYAGNYAGRLHFASALFVCAAVLVSRISIEQGREYASMFALPLSIVTLLSMLRYTDMSLFLAVPLIGFIWWSTDKLTWDCTVLDFQKDASGQGLLQSAGMDVQTDEAGNDLSDDDELATTQRSDEQAGGLWQRWLHRRRRHHTPGVWVLYFGLAAIPLFGLGQWFIQPVKQGPCFLLLCIYVASALALLMTTSFLQMRRYLAQRRLPFTDGMASTWLATGGMMIVGLMCVCLFLPRPNTGYSWLDSLDRVSSRDDLQASRWAWGEEGIDDQQLSGEGRANSEDDSQAEEGADDQPSDSGSGQGNQREGRESSNRGDQANQQSSDGSKEGSRDGSESSQGESSNGEQSSGDRQGDRASEQSDRGAREDRSARSEQSDADSESNSRSGDSPQNGDRQSRDRDSGRSQPDEQQHEGSDSNQSRTESQDADRPSSTKTPAERMQQLTESLPQLSMPSLPRLVYWILIVLGMAVLLYFYGRQLAAAVSSFWRDFWAWLSGLRRGDADDTAEPLEEATPEQPQRAFSSYPDPFALGTADRYTPAQLVTYTFDALQAWGRERQCERGDEQTPLEYARALHRLSKPISESAQRLGILYNQVAYAPGSLNADALVPLRQLWKQLRAGAKAESQA